MCVPMTRVLGYAAPARHAAKEHVAGCHRRLIEVPCMPHDCVTLAGLCCPVPSPMPAPSMPRRERPCKRACLRASTPPPPHTHCPRIVAPPLLSAAPSISHPQFCLCSVVQDGFYEFWNWFDWESWHPLGRVVGGTVYPGLMFTAAALYKVRSKLQQQLGYRFSYPD